MSGKLKGIIAAAAVLIVLAGAVVILKLTEKPDEADPTTTGTTAPEVTAIELYSYETTAIKSLDITNELGKVKLEKTGEAEWQIKEYDGLPFDSSAVTKLMESAASFDAKSLIEENAADLSLYGLDKPVMKAEITLTDGTQTRLLVGNKAPAGNEYYFMLGGKNAVYTVSGSALSDLMKCKKTDLLFKTLISASDENGAPLKVNKLLVQRSDKDYQFVFEYDIRADDETKVTANSSCYIMTSPVRMDIHPDNGVPTVECLLGLAASDLLVTNPTEEDLSKYGMLDTPAAVMMLTTSADKTYPLLVGNKITAEDCTESYPVLLTGVNVIWSVAAESLPIMTCEPLDVTATMIGGVYIYNLKELDMITPRETLKFTMTGSTADDFTLAQNGTAADLELFKKLYQFILRAPAEELYNGTDDLGTPDLKLDFKTTTGENQTIEFYKSADRKTIVAYNGDPQFTTRTTYLDRLLENIENYKNGKEIIGTW